LKYALRADVLKIIDFAGFHAARRNAVAYSRLV
jgi:hypothetical protein